MSPPLNTPLPQLHQSEKIVERSAVEDEDEDEAETTVALGTRDGEVIIGQCDINHENQSK